MLLPCLSTHRHLYNLVGVGSKRAYHLPIVSHLEKLPSLPLFGHGSGRARERTNLMRRTEMEQPAHIKQLMCSRVVLPIVLCVAE